MIDLLVARDKLLGASCAVVAGEKNRDANPEDATADAQLELTVENLDDAARKYVRELDR